jgi:hypothetical protein
MEHTKARSLMSAPGSVPRKETKKETHIGGAEVFCDDMEWAVSLAEDVGDDDWELVDDEDALVVKDDEVVEDDEVVADDELVGDTVVVAEGDDEGDDVVSEDNAWELVDDEDALVVEDDELVGDEVVVAEGDEEGDDDDVPLGDAEVVDEADDVLEEVPRDDIVAVDDAVEVGVEVGGYLMKARSAAERSVL